MREWETNYMKDTDWEILYELHKTKNITMVANRLFLSQPSVTKRIQNIEENFHVKIVIRNTRGVEFTKEGELLAKKAEEYLCFMRDIRKELDAMQNQEKKYLRIGASYTYSKYVLSDILTEFSKSHPEYQIDIEIEQSNILYNKVCIGELDFAIVRGDYENVSLEKCKLDTSKAYILSKDAITVEELPTLTRIDYKTNDRTSELLENWWKEYFPVEAAAGINAGYVDVAWQLVEKGLGYTCCFMSDQYNMSKKLVRMEMLHKDGTPLERNTWCMYNKRKVSEEMGVFLDFLENR